MPIEIPAAAGEPYRPSNGTEGEMFMEIFCAKCIHDQDENDPCPIPGSAFVFNINEEGYPKEWRFDDGGELFCAAFVMAPEKIVLGDK